MKSKKRKLVFLSSLLTVCMVFSGCSEKKEVSNNSGSSVDINDSSVADETSKEHVTAPIEEIIIDGDPVFADDLNDGTYNITVDSSSSMFKIVDCQLNVSDGKMTAVMTMNGKGYLYLFMGKGEDATDESKYINYEEAEDGTHKFTVPVESLNSPIECSAFSKKKEEWYDRTIVFRTENIPEEAFKNSISNTVESLEIKDGEYKIDVTLSGGSGKAKIESPANLKVENGIAYAEIVWGSSNYDYMVVDEQKIEPENTDGNSVFIIPVNTFDKKIQVSADTTAMSTPHEIEYELFFDSGTITQ